MLLIDGAIVASAGSMEGKIERGIYYPALKFTPKELAFHRSSTLTFPTAKNVIEGLRQRNPVVFNRAFKIFDISSDVTTGWHPEDQDVAFSHGAVAFSVNAVLVVSRSNE